jgi:hypothetical protein
MTDNNKTLQFDTSAEDYNSKKAVEVSMNLKPFVNFNYFNEVNTFNECLGGYEDFTNTYYAVNNKLEKEREEAEMREFYKDVVYTMTPGQEDELNRYNEYIQSFYNECKQYRAKTNYNEHSSSSDTDSDY